MENMINTVNLWARLHKTTNEQYIINIAVK